MEAVWIVDADDPRIAAYRNIRERDLSGRQGRFVAEGRVVLNILMQSMPRQIESLLILENRLAGLHAALKQLPAAVPIYVVASGVMDSVAGFPMHRGIIAIARRPPELDAAAILSGLPDNALVVAAIGIANHDNIGAIFRNAAAFGAGAVLMDASCCDPLYRKAIRVSVGAALKVPFARVADVDGLVRKLRDMGFRQFALSPSGTIALSAIQPGGKTALYLGTEGDGLPETMMRAVETVRIGMAPGFDSLNVAAASAVALHALSDFD